MKKDRTVDYPSFVYKRLDAESIKNMGIKKLIRKI